MDYKFNEGELVIVNELHHDYKIEPYLQYEGAIGFVIARVREDKSREHCYNVFFPFCDMGGVNYIQFFESELRKADADE